MKKNIFKTVIVSLLFSLFGCGEGYLLLDPKGVISESALQNKTGVDLLVTNAYANMTENGFGATPFNWAFGSVLGGDANKGSDAGDQSVVNELETYNALTTNGYVNEKWVWVYKGVQRISLPLRVIASTADLPADFVKTRTGELKFLRALYYFEGIKLIGSTGMAWVDETMLENDPLAYNGTDIWPQVMKDIDEAIASLPATQPEVGRANVWAAKALKAKMLVQQGKLSEAKDILADVLTNGVTTGGVKFALADDMNDNFNAFTDNGCESIFAAQHSVDANNNGMPGFALNYPHNVTASQPGGCCGFFQPSWDLVNAYQVDENGLPYLDYSYRTKPSVSYYDEKMPDEKSRYINRSEVPVDPRLDFAVGRQGITYKDWGVCFQGGEGIRDRGNGGIFLPKKHVFTKKELDAGYASRSRFDGWAPGSAANLQYLSVRDCILLYAECLANDGDLSGAMAQVNLIRDRADKEVNKPKFADGSYCANYKISNYPPTHAAFSNKEVCMEAIRFERRLELAMEGQRWYDLARWGGEYMSKHIWDYITYEKDFLSKFISASKLSPSRTVFFVPEGQITTKGVDKDGKPFLQQNAAWK